MRKKKNAGKEGNEEAVHIKIRRGLTSKKEQVFASPRTLKAIKLELTNTTRDDLREICKEQKLLSGGTKDEIVNRLMKSLGRKNPSPQEYDYEILEKRVIGKEEEFLVRYHGLDPNILEWRRRRSLFGDEIEDETLELILEDNKENETPNVSKSKGNNKKKRKSRSSQPETVNEEVDRDHKKDEVLGETLPTLSKSKSKKPKKQIEITQVPLELETFHDGTDQVDQLREELERKEEEILRLVSQVDSFISRDPKPKKVPPLALTIPKATREKESHRKQLEDILSIREQSFQELLESLSVQRQQIRKLEHDLQCREESMKLLQESYRSSLQLQMSSQSESYRLQLQLEEKEKEVRSLQVQLAAAKEENRTSTKEDFLYVVDENLRLKEELEKLQSELEERRLIDSASAFADRLQNAKESTKDIKEWFQDQQKALLEM